MADIRDKPYYVGFYFRDDEDETLAANKGTILFAVASCDPILEPIGKGIVWYDDGTGKTSLQTRVKWEMKFIPFENNLKYKDDAVLPNIEKIPWLHYVFRSKVLQIQGTDFPSLARPGAPSSPIFPVYFNQFSLPSVAIR